jgi:hypothetical protein
MNVERLKRAIAIIEATPSKQLNLRFWQRGEKDTTKKQYVSSVQEVHCGTIACAAGWLALNPEMNAEGLSCGPFGYPVFEEHTQFAALQHFFDIRDVEAYRLFNSRTIFEQCGGRELLSDKQIWLVRATQLLATAE